MHLSGSFTKCDQCWWFLMATWSRHKRFSIFSLYASRSRIHWLTACPNSTSFKKYRSNWYVNVDLANSGLINSGNLFKSVVFPLWHWTTKHIGRITQIGKPHYGYLFQNFNTNFSLFKSVPIYLQQCINSYLLHVLIVRNVFLSLFS